MDILKIESDQHCLTGIPGIDVQHKELFMMLDGFLNSLKTEKFSPDIIQAAIQDIFEHMRSHLFTEENLMEMVAFPKVADHKAQHKNIFNLLTEERKILKNLDNSKLSRFLCSYRNIALVHISIFDFEYANFIENAMAVKKKSSITAIRAPQAIAG